VRCTDTDTRDVETGQRGNRTPPTPAWTAPYPQGMWITNSALWGTRFRPVQTLGIGLGTGLESRWPTACWL